MHGPDGPDMPIDPAVATVQVWRVQDSRTTVQPDELAVEEPLEIRLACDQDGRRVRRGISVTMRTPGHDGELAVGFLFTEGILEGPEQVAKVDDWGPGNVVRVELNPGVAVDLARLERHFYAASSCGVCGKASLEAVRVRPRLAPIAGRPAIDAAVIHRLPETLRAARALRPHRRPARRGAVRPRRPAARPARGRRPAQRPGQAHRHVLPRRAARRCTTPPAGQRPRQLRTGAEGGRRRHPGAGGRRRTVEPRRQPRPRARHDRHRLRPARTLQHLFGPRSDRPSRPGHDGRPARRAVNLSPVLIRVE